MLAEGEIEKRRGERGIKQLRAWLKHEGLWTQVSPEERKLFDAGPGGLSEQQVINASWRAEAFWMILWSLRMVEELPAWDAEVNPQEGLKLLPEVGTSTSSFIESAQLRPASEIARARDLAELWHWRARTTQLQIEGHSHPEYDLEEIVRTAAKAAEEDGSVPNLIGGDFPAFGKPFRDLPEAEFYQMMSIAQERHFALNWLSGYSEGGWDETPTDT